MRTLSGNDSANARMRKVAPRGFIDTSSRDHRLLFIALTCTRSNKDVAIDTRVQSDIRTSELGGTSVLIGADRISRKARLGHSTVTIDTIGTHSTNREPTRRTASRNRRHPIERPP
jgi:hypothetical protein